MVFRGNPKIIFVSIAKDTAQAAIKILLKRVKARKFLTFKISKDYSN